MQNDTWEELATTLADMARDLLAQESLQATLDCIVRYAVDIVDGCDAAGILSLNNAQVTSLAATSDLVRASDALQGELAEGPCFDTTWRIQEAYRIADMTAHEERWPHYVPRACELGIGSIMGFLLYTEDDNLGALNLYSTRPNSFTERSERVGWLLASHAAVSFSSARTHAQLQSAIETRQEIGAALGILMERYKVTEERAFAVLKKSSQDHNRKLRDVARVVAEKGEIPGAR